MHKKILKNTAAGTFTGAAVCLVLTLLVTFIALKTSDPTAVCGNAALPIIAASAFCGGLIAAKKNAGQGIVCGAAVGGAFCLVLFILSLIPEGGGRYYFLLLPVFLSSLLGGLFGRPSVRRKKRRSKQRSG